MPTNNKNAKLRQYRRSTPIGRLRRNAAKIARHAALIQVRIISWGEVVDDRVAEVLAKVGQILKLFSFMDTILEGLEESGFAPPVKSGTMSYQAGQHVMIAPKARLKYETVFKTALQRDPCFLEDLVVSDVLPSGEVVIRRGHQLPFMVPKSHLLPAKNLVVNGRIH